MRDTLFGRKGLPLRIWYLWSKALNRQSFKCCARSSALMLCTSSLENAAQETMPCGIPRLAGYHAGWDLCTCSTQYSVLLMSRDNMPQHSTTPCNTGQHRQLRCSFVGPGRRCLSSSTAFARRHVLRGAQHKAVTVSATAESRRSLESSGASWPCHGCQGPVAFSAPSIVVISTSSAMPRMSNLMTLSPSLPSPTFSAAIVSKIFR